MSQGDLLSDRKRLKRSLTQWRGLAIVAMFLGAILLVQGRTGGSTPTAMGRDYIAQITVDGIIADDKERDALLKKITEDKNAKALLVRLDSPGGTTVGGEELYLQLREVAKHKPVVGTMRTLCASACYMASLGTDHVVARGGTLTGSIGVLLQSVEVSELAKKLGITPITIKSGKYKDVPSFTDPFTEAERDVVGAVVTDAYNDFVSLIVERRNMPDAQVRALSDGRVYTGRQALQEKLIDGLGGPEEAVNWLAEKHKLSKKLEIREMDAQPKYPALLGRLSQWTGIKIFGSMPVGLDGLISIWQHPAM